VRAQRGVSLLLILVMLVLLVGFLATYALTRTASFLVDETATAARLKKVGDALDSYAASAKRLPCPANPATDTGEEVTATASTCSFDEGTLPWKTIGLGRADGYDEWGFKLSYRVYVNGGDGSLTQPRGIDMTHCDSGQTTSDALAAGRVCTESNDPYAHNQSSTLFLTNKGLRLIDNGTDLSNRAYVVISHGQTALGAYTSSGSRMELPVGDERDNAGTGPYRIKAFSDSDTPATNAQHFDDLLFFRTVEDVAKRAGLAARDWPEHVRFDSATVSAAVGNSNANTGRNSFTANGVTVTASSGNVSFSSADGTSGIGVVTAVNDYTLQNGEYLRLEFPQLSSKAVLTLSGFGYFDLLGTRFREQVRLRFYNGSSPVGTTYLRQACSIGVDGLATLVLQPSDVGGIFTTIEIEGENITPNLFIPLSSSFLIAEATACGPTATSCQTGLATTANTCFTPSITGTAFAPASISQGSSSVLTFTIANGTDSTAHSGMAFNAVLPANMTVVNPASPSTSTTCASASVTAPNASGIAVSGLGIANGVATCSVSVQVTTLQAGGYSTSAGTVTGTANLLVSPSFTGATLTVVP
jgi:hypothetical protein